MSTDHPNPHGSNAALENIEGEHNCLIPLELPYQQLTPQEEARGALVVEAAIEAIFETKTPRK